MENVSIRRVEMESVQPIQIVPHLDQFQREYILNPLVHNASALIVTELYLPLVLQAPLRHIHAPMENVRIKYVKMASVQPIQTAVLHIPLVRQVPLRHTHARMENVPIKYVKIASVEHI